MPPIPPAPAVFNQRVIDVGALEQEHISMGVLADMDADAPVSHMCLYCGKVPHDFAGFCGRVGIGVAAQTERRVNKIGQAVGGRTVRSPLVRMQIFHFDQRRML